jgi:hypothetical protein
MLGISSTDDNMKRETKIDGEEINLARRMPSLGCYAVRLL